MKMWAGKIVEIVRIPVAVWVRLGRLCILPVLFPRKLGEQSKIENVCEFGIMPKSRRTAYFSLPVSSR